MSTPDLAPFDEVLATATDTDAISGTGNLVQVLVKRAYTLGYGRFPAPPQLPEADPAWLGEPAC